MKFKLIAPCAFALACMTFVHVKAQHSISGKITSTKGEAVPFAAIGIKNTQLSLITNESGEFRFSGLQPDTYVLQVHSVGFLTKTDTLQVTTDVVYNPIMTVSNKQLDEVVVNATRVDNDNGMAYSNVSSETIQKQNLGQDAPYMLNQLANVVVNSDAGNGVGYTGMWIRGSDATRVNVTINGIPVNDAESQGVFWVNMPDLLSSTNNIQVQRGVGASSNGAGAFGASINFQTNSLQEKPYANVISTAGSYDTFRNTLAAGTGLMNNKFTLDARASSISSSGYIDRAKSNLQSYYLAAGYYGAKSVLKFINFMGQEKTYQAWNYVPEDSLKAGNRTYNSCGELYDANGNVSGYYANETDNYKQNNFQLHFIHKLNARVNFNISAHYTKGRGYYEQYKQDQSLDRYKISPLVTPKGDTINRSDLIRRLWLDNDFVGAIFNVNYTPKSRLAITLGGGYNTYFGRHFDRVIWSRYASDSEMDHEYDFNTANKNDANIYLKINYKPISQLSIFVDLQERAVSYRFLGFDDQFVSGMREQSYLFFNPKMGLSYNLTKQLNLYASAAVGHKEPNRNDFVQSTPKSRPLPEQMIDVEAGLKLLFKKAAFVANFYNMQYNNQLVLNGQINDVGAYNRINVPSSFRRGLELEAGADLNKYFSVSANLSLSQNKINNFTEYVDVYDTNGDFVKQEQIRYSNTDISFSPSSVSSVVLSFKPFKNFELSLINKSVGRQYLDNTSNEKRSIDPYNVTDLRINYGLRSRLIPEINVMVGIYNIFSHEYATNGYTYGYFTGSERSHFNFYAPAAPLNFLAGLSLKF